MKKLILFFIFTCALLMPDIRDCFGQSITWQRLYDIPGGNDSYSKATCHADSGNFYSGGTAFIGGDYRIFVMKLNPFGDTIWTKRIDTLSRDVYAMTPTNDGGCIITGDSHYAIKLSSTGNIVWARNFGGTGIELLDIIKTLDNKYVATGRFFDINTFTTNGYLIKFDNNGLIEWQKVFPSGLAKVLNSIIEVNIGNYIITGYSYNYPGDTGKVILMKCNGNGDTIWNRDYTESNKTIEGYDIELINGIFLIAGIISDLNNGFTNTFLMKIDTTGKHLSTYIFEANFDESFIDLKILNANSFVYVKDREYGPNLVESHVMKLDSMGNIQTEKFFRLESVASFRSMLVMSNGDYIFAGDGRRNLPSPYKTYIVRTDSSLYSPPISIKSINSNVPTDYFLYQNFPNPFNPNTKIEFHNKKNAWIEILIYDINGRIMEKLVNKKFSIGKHSIEFDANVYASGVYFYSMVANGILIETRKMILLQ